MAKISISPPSPPNPANGPAKPSWMNDFSDQLMVTYGCTRADFNCKVPGRKNPGSRSLEDLVFWLNLFANAGGAPPAAADDPIQTVMPSGSSQGILVKQNEISSATKTLSTEQALEMAILALANPAMRGKPVTLHGSKDEIKLLTLACEQVGLTVKNAATVDQKKDSKFIKSVQTKWEKMHSQQCKAHDTRIKHVKTAFNAYAITNPLSPDAKTALGGFDETQYQKIKEKIWNDQDVSTHKIMTDFGVSATDAPNIMEAMRKEEFIFHDSTQGKDRVCMTDQCEWAPSV